MNASLGLMKWNKVHFRVGRFVNANQPLVISCFCYGQPPHSDGMGICEGKVGELLWGEWVQGCRGRDYRLRPQPVPSGFTIDKVSGR